MWAGPGRGPPPKIGKPYWSPCAFCKGTGVDKRFRDPRTAGFQCPTCGGKGDVIVYIAPWEIPRLCHYCNSTGRNLSTPCKACGGVGITCLNQRYPALKSLHGWD